MARAVYVGDEVSAAGWRLAGVATRGPGAGQEAGALDAAMAEAPLVLVSAAVAARIDAARLEAALAGLQPLVLVVPDPQGRTPLPDLAARLRAQLGIAA
jgi:vacuolar-type H+-ATPase subunit F/Vma7